MHEEVFELKNKTKQQQQVILNSFSRIVFNNISKFYWYDSLVKDCKARWTYVCKFTFTSYFLFAIIMMA